MLFTDGNFVATADLQIIDGEFQDVATEEGITVDASASSLITRSLSELGEDLTSKFQNFSGYLMGIGMDNNHVAAVLNVLSTAINRPRAFLNQVVVSEPNPTKLPVKRWAEYICLHAFYRAVYHRKLNDRYEKKMLMYEKEKKAAWARLKGNGVPIVLTPLPAPAAGLEYNPGTWADTANVMDYGSGSSDPGTTYQVAVTWVAIPPYVSASVQGNGESAGSTIISHALAAGKFLKVDITSLNPPNGMPAAIGTADGVYSPVVATHWNMYVGAKTGPLYLQNASPIAIATKTNTLAATPTLSGTILNAGQAAQYNFSQQNIIWRA